MSKWLWFWYIFAAILMAVSIFNQSTLGAIVATYILLDVRITRLEERNHE